MICFVKIIIKKKKENLINQPTNAEHVCRNVLNARCSSNHLKEHKSTKVVLRNYQMPHLHNYIFNPLM